MNKVFNIIGLVCFAILSIGLAASQTIVYITNYLNDLNQPITLILAGIFLFGGLCCIGTTINEITKE